MLYLATSDGVPFAFAMGSLITRAERRSLDAYHAPLEPGDLVVPGVGVLMGASWAYAASVGAATGPGTLWRCVLLPWLSATAYLHSV